jgi:hypothetical protein
MPGKSKKSRKKKETPPTDFQRLHALDHKLGQIKRREFPDERFVAFIDLLGFRDVLNRMFTNEPQLFKTVLEVLELAKSFADTPDPENMRAITAFSDSVVITSGGPFGTAGLLATVGVLAGEFLKRGILCRGGIARGRMYHADGILFGEALVRAYDIERDVAKTPRIVIDDNVAPAIFFLIDDQIPRVKRDIDGKLILNVFAHFWDRADIDAPNAIVADHWGGSADEEGLLVVRHVLEEALLRTQSGDPDILKKIRWAAGQFNETLIQIQTSTIEPLNID